MSGQTFVPVQLVESGGQFWRACAVLDGVRLAWFGSSSRLVLNRAHTEIARRVVAAAIARVA